MVAWRFFEWRQRAKVDPEGRKMEETEESFLNNCLVSGIESSIFVITKKGYMGLAEGQVEVGDKVFVVRGSSVPLVLRPVTKSSRKGVGNSTRYTLVGRAYVHGIMDGEMWKDEAGLWMQKDRTEAIELV
jgi:hypothetical protein